MNALVMKLLVPVALCALLLHASCVAGQQISAPCLTKGQAMQVVILERGWRALSLMLPA
jgi:hypothetical protein